MERNIRILKVIYGLTGFLPASAIWILYFAQVTGHVAEGAFIFAAGMVVAALFDVPTGVFSDRVGRRAGAIMGTAALALCVVAYAFAFNWWSLLIASVLDGIGMATLSGNNQALLHESLSALGREDEFARQYGKMLGWMHWCAVSAALTGAGLASISLRWAVIASIPSYVIAAVLAWTLQEPERHIDQAEPLVGHARTALKMVTGNRRLAVLALAGMLSGGISMAAFVLRPTWTQMLWPVWAIGLTRAVSALFAAIGSWWGGALIARIGPLRALASTQIVSSIADIAALAIASVVSPAVLTSSSLAFGVGNTADAVLLQNEFTDEQRATMGSLVSVGTRCVYAFAAVGFGLVANSAAGGALIGAEVLMLVSVVMYVGAFRVPARSHKSKRQAETYAPG